MAKNQSFSINRHPYAVYHQKAVLMKLGIMLTAVLRPWLINSQTDSTSMPL